jgi:hypothetical protein
MAETIVFFRDDDVGEMTASLHFVMQTLIDKQIPCHYQVVPAYLDPPGAEALRDLQRAHPALVHLNQHGLRHSQEIGGVRVATEFAGGRPFEEQLRDIRAGRAQLMEALGDSFSPDVFTPPCHKYDRATLRALGDLGFRTLSAGVRSDVAAQAYYAIGRRLGRVEMLGKRVSYHLRRTPDRRLREVSVALDMHEELDPSGRRVDKSADRLWAEFDAIRARLPVLGVMLHHQACDSEESERALLGFTTRLADDPDVRVASIGELESEGRIPVI